MSKRNMYQTNDETSHVLMAVIANLKCYLLYHFLFELIILPNSWSEVSKILVIDEKRHCSFFNLKKK